MFLDQWSPINPEGKRLYDRDFLLQMQYAGDSTTKPAGLPDLPDIILDKVSCVEYVYQSCPDCTRYMYHSMWTKGLKVHLSVRHLVPLIVIKSKVNRKNNVSKNLPGRKWYSYFPGNKPIPYFESGFRLIAG